MLRFEELIGDEEKALVLKALNETSISQGKFVNKFEEKFCNYLGIKNAIATMNGTATLHLALESLGIKKGDEVIVPSFTFIATANAVIYAGAKPVFVNADEEDFCINPDLIEEKINEKTKAIIPVHIFGHPADMDKINNIAKKNNLFVIEDAAESLGSLYKNKKTGTLSDISCFSFYSNKILSTGEGGMCATNDNELNKKMRLLRAQGKVKTEELNDENYAQKQYYHDMLGFNYRMTEIQAALGIPQLNKMYERLRRKRQIAKIYEKELNGLVEFQNEKKYAKSCYWIFAILAKDKKEQIKIANEFKKNKIPFRSFFWPIDKQPFYENSYCEISSKIAERGMMLPCNSLAEGEDINRVRKAIMTATK